MRNAIFTAICLVVAAATFGVLRLIGNDYLFFAGYVVLQYVVLAMAWNVLGGYTGYVNFGSAAFFALGAYSTVALHKFDPGKPLEVCIPFGACFDLDLSVLAPVFPLPIPVLIVFAAIFSGAVGLGMGYLTLRLRGAFFAIATLAMAVVLQTFVINWSYVGGARGAYVIRPNEIAFIGPYIHYLFLLMLGLAVMAIVAARLWVRGDPRRRVGGRSRRRAHPQAQADRHDHLGGAHGHGRRTLPLLHRLCATGDGVRARIRGEFDRDADDRRHHLLGRTADRRDPARRAATVRHRDDIVGRQPPDRRPTDRRMRDRRAQRDSRADPRPRHRAAGDSRGEPGPRHRVGGVRRSRCLHPALRAQHRADLLPARTGRGRPRDRADLLGDSHLCERRARAHCRRALAPGAADCSGRAQRRHPEHPAPAERHSGPRRSGPGSRRARQPRRRRAGDRLSAARVAGHHDRRARLRLAAQIGRGPHREAGGGRRGLVGPNGSGKSTLVNCMCGTLRNETGKVSFDGQPIDGLSAHERTRRGLARSFQLPPPLP